MKSIGNCMPERAYSFSMFVKLYRSKTRIGNVLTFRSAGRQFILRTVSMTDSNGVVRTATTSSFGLFSFDNIATGNTYTMRILSRLYRYAPQIVQVNSNLTLPDFVGLD